MRNHYSGFVYFHRLCERVLLCNNKKYVLYMRGSKPYVIPFLLALICTWYVMYQMDLQAVPAWFEGLKEWVYHNIPGAKYNAHYSLHFWRYFPYLYTVCFVFAIVFYLFYFSIYYPRKALFGDKKINSFKSVLALYLKLALCFFLFVFWAFLSFFYGLGMEEPKTIDDMAVGPGKGEAINLWMYERKWGAALLYPFFKILLPALATGYFFQFIIRLLFAMGHVATALIKRRFSS